jgi:hypothetical protein
LVKHALQTILANGAKECLNDGKQIRQRGKDRDQYESGQETQENKRSLIPHQWQDERVSRFESRCALPLRTVIVIPFAMMVEATVAAGPVIVARMAMMANAVAMLADKLIKEVHAVLLSATGCCLK